MAISVEPTREDEVFIFEDEVFTFGIPDVAFVNAGLGDIIVTIDDVTLGGDPLSELPSWLKFNLETRTFSGTPPKDFVGTIAIDVTATDSFGTQATASFLVTVENVNDAPRVLQPLDDQTAQAGVEFIFPLPAETFFDVDFAVNPAETLTYSATLEGGAALPGWLTFDAETRTFSGTPTEANAGTSLSVTVTVTDAAGASVSDTFTLTLAEPPGAVIEGTECDDKLVGTAFNDEMLGHGGDDKLYGREGDDVLDGGRGDDKLYGEEGNDVLFGQSGDDRLEGGDGNDVLSGDSGDDSLDGGDGDDQLDGGSGDDRLEGKDGNDALTGGTGDDRLDGGAGNDFLDGSEGDDRLEGGSGDDVLAGGPGRDELDGGQGNDLYIHEQLGGNDEIKEKGGQDTLLFGHGITAGSVKLYRQGSDLVVNLAGQDGRVTIEGWFSSASKTVERIEFADGTAWDAAYIRTHLERGSAPKPLKPTHDYDDDDDDDHHGKPDCGCDDGHDGHTYGGAYVLGITGGPDNPYVIGTSGNDTLVWNSAYTFDGGAGTDTLRVAGGSLDLTATANTKIQNIEQIDLSGYGNNGLKLDMSDVLDTSSTTNMLKVLGDAGDSVDIAGSFTVLAEAGGFRFYKVGTAVLLVDTDITSVT